ncbi:hypothetical protein [Mycobacterium gordonae]|nr:hypothetical protein [Mycobacterium gordonae]MCV7004601.1 hypothetical protein [Mycobacterium gordonae]
MKNSGKARKQAAAKREATVQDLDWDRLIANLKAMLNLTDETTEETL